MPDPKPNQTPVLRDPDRFRYYTNDVAKIPLGYRAPLCLQPTRELIEDRIRKISNR